MRFEKATIPVLKENNDNNKIMLVTIIYDMTVGWSVIKHSNQKCC